MNDKQRIFCAEYIKDLNATAAAIRAGYSEKTATPLASRLLTKVNIKEEIQRLMDKRAKKAELTAENILESIIDIRNTCAAKLEIKSKTTGKVIGTSMVDAQGALKANELLGKHLKLFTDKIEHGGEIRIPDIIIKRADKE